MKAPICMKAPISNPCETLCKPYTLTTSNMTLFLYTLDPKTLNPNPLNPKTWRCRVSGDSMPFQNWSRTLAQVRFRARGPPSRLACWFRVQIHLGFISLSISGFHNDLPSGFY